MLGGNKVRAFFACIIAPHTSTDVVVDRHALALALDDDRLQVLDDHYTKGCVGVLERSGAYEHVAAAYRKAAAELGLLPHQVQATTWLVHRRTKRPNRSTLSTFEVPDLPPADPANDWIDSQGIF